MCMDGFIVTHLLGHCYRNKWHEGVKPGLSRVWAGIMVYCSHFRPWLIIHYLVLGVELKVAWNRCSRSGKKVSGSWFPPAGQSQFLLLAG